MKQAKKREDTSPACWIGRWPTDKPLALLAGRASFARSKSLLHSRIGKQIFASDPLRTRYFANQNGNARIEVGSVLCRGRFWSCHGSLFEIWFGFASGMAKKSLKKRIDDLVDALGAAEKPSTAEIRNELFAIGPLIEAFEGGQALTEKEATIAALEEENENLKIELQAANAERERFQEEQIKREEKEREIPPIQSQILGLLSGEQSGNALSVEQIAYDTSMPADEIEVHLDKLWKAGLATSQHSRREGWTWRRTREGNKSIVALRSTGEEEKKRCKYADLPEIQQQALLEIVEGSLNEHEIAKILDKKLRLVRHHLHSLRDAEMATDAEEHPGDAVSVYSADDAGMEATDSPMWRILRDGERYLAERDLL